MAKNREQDDNTGSNSQSPLQAGSSVEQTEFREVLNLLVAGQITSKEAQTRVMMIYQLGIGAGLRAFGEVKPEIIADVISKLTRDLGGISHTYDPRVDITETVDKTHAPAMRVKNKNIETLLRERIILKAILTTNRLLSSAELHKLVAEDDSNIKAATVIANLDRLNKMKLIDRPRKGSYGKSEYSKDYLSVLEDEIYARAID